MDVVGDSYQVYNRYASFGKLGYMSILKSSASMLQIYMNNKVGELIMFCIA